MSYSLRWLARASNLPSLGLGLGLGQESSVSDVVKCLLYSRLDVKREALLLSHWLLVLRMLFRKNHQHNKTLRGRIRESCHPFKTVWVSIYTCYIWFSWVESPSIYLNGGHTGRILAWGLDKTKNGRGSIFFQYSVKQAWLIRDLLLIWNYMKIIKSDFFGSYSTVPALILGLAMEKSGMLILVIGPLN